MAEKKVKVATLGSGKGQPGDQMYDKMVEVGRLLAERGCIVVNGGFGGTGMEAPSKGAKEAGGEVIGYTLAGKPGNQFLTHQIDCSQWDKEINLGFSGYGIRLCALLDADAFIIAAGGGIGTLTELMAIVLFQQKIWKKKKKVVILYGSANEKSTEEKLIILLKEQNLFPDIELLVESDPVNAVDWLLSEMV